MPSRRDLTPEGADVPLFGDATPAPRARPQRVGVYPATGVNVTCYVCIGAVARGEQLDFPRSPATWTVILPSGYEWLICSSHKALHEAGKLVLKDPS